MNEPKIPILDLKPQYESIKTEIHEAIDRVLESGRFIMGEDVKLFEKEVADYLGVKHAIGVNSGTDALVIGLKALGIADGDEVITTPFSFFATAESISNVGATPVFADIEADSFNINPEVIKTKITSKTKAILPVHLYGQPAAMSQIMEIASSHGLKVIEDCAQSFGARYSGKQTGTIGDIGAYSFFPSKNLGAYGDGGLIATDNDELAETARMLRVHGAKKKYYNEVFGYNSRLDSIQAAILRVKLKYIDDWNTARWNIAKIYNELLVDVPHVIAPQLLEGNVFHQYTVRITNNKRDAIKDYLATYGISTMIYYPTPQDKLPVYQGQYDSCVVSDLSATQVLSLPIWAELQREMAAKIIATMKNFK